GDEREIGNEAVGCADRVDHPRLRLLAEGRARDLGDRAPVGGGLRPDPQRHSSSSTSSAPPATRSPSRTWTRRTVASYGATSGVSIFIASSTSSGWRACTASPSATSTRITVPGIGAVTALPPPPAPCWRCAVDASGGGSEGGE